jgi:hypothetical protein
LNCEFKPCAKIPNKTEKRFQFFCNAETWTIKLRLQIRKYPEFPIKHNINTLQSKKGYEMHLSATSRSTLGGEHIQQNAPRSSAMTREKLRTATVEYFNGFTPVHLITLDDAESQKFGRLSETNVINLQRKSRVMLDFINQKTLGRKSLANNDTFRAFACFETGLRNWLTHVHIITVSSVKSERDTAWVRGFVKNKWANIRATTTEQVANQKSHKFEKRLKGNYNTDVRDVDNLRCTINYITKQFSSNMFQDQVCSYMFY